MRRYMQTFFRTLILGLSVPALFMSAFISCSYGAPRASTDMPVDDSGYLLGPEDVLLISVWKDEQLTREVVVRLDGNNVDEGHRILLEANHPLVTVVDTMDGAADKAAELAHAASD